MIIFRKRYEEACKQDAVKDGAGEELKNLLKEADSLVKRAEEGVKSKRAPMTIVEKVQLSDTTKLVKKLIIDLSRDITSGRVPDKNREKLEKAVTALRTSIENIL